MVWNIILSIIMAIISYITTKKGNKKNEGKALAAAAAAGLGTYYFTTETEWGKDSVAWLNDNVANLDGTVPVVEGGTETIGKDGSVIKVGADGKPIPATSGFWDTLKSWGATGTATVIGTGAVAGGLLSGDWVKWGLIGLGAYLILK